MCFISDVHQLFKSIPVDTVLPKYKARLQRRCAPPISLQPFHGPWGLYGTRGETHISVSKTKVYYCFDRKYFFILGKKILFFPILKDKMSTMDTHELQG